MKASVIVLAYGDQPWLEATVKAVKTSKDVQVELIVVDNGATKPIAPDDGVRVIRPGKNLGFAGGCNLGAEHATGEVIVLLNGDAIPEPEAIARLAEAAMEPGVGIATASLRLADTPDLLNSGGNAVHFLGFGWAGHFGEPASNFRTRRPVAAASGGAMAIRTDTWRELGGFAPEFFAYHEDAELSIRCWQRGLAVMYVPEAVVVHHYEFSRNPLKLYLLERNRLLFVITTYGAKALLLLAPALVALEVGMLAVALLQGWFAAKLRGWVWIVTNLRWVLSRRRSLQRHRVVADRQIVPLLSARFDAANAPLPRVLAPVDLLLAAYWGIVRRFI